MRNTSTTQQITLADALRQCQQQHIIILRARGGCVQLWNAGRPIARSVRQVIRANEREVLRMLDIGDVRVCVNPSLHYASWDMFKGHQICAYCSRLDRHLRSIAA